MVLFYKKVIPPMAKALGTQWFKLHKSRRLIAEENIKLALNYGAKESYELAHRNFVHLARVFLEFTMLPQINERNVQEFATFEGEEYFISHQGSRICFMSGHIGNWELMAYVSSLLGGPKITIIARQQRPLWFNNLLQRIRSKTGNRLLDKNQALASLSKTIRTGQIVALLMDQKAVPKEGIYVKFFNRKVLTHKSLALIAIKTKSLVLPIYNLRIPDGRYRIKFLKPLEITREGRLETRIIEATARFNNILETMIREDPTQWYWIHRRFQNSLPL